MALPINYASSYAQALAQAYPYVLNFGALYATENNGRYRMGEDGKTVYIPNITTTGRVDSSRDTIGLATRNYDNAWEPKTLKNQRKWSTLVHPKDIDQTNMVASIQNITQVFNSTQKFPEMDAYLISTLYDLWTSVDPLDSTDEAKTPDTTELTTKNVLEVFDSLMTEMDEARVPANGRILYVTSQVKKLLKQAEGLVRTFDTKDAGSNVNRSVSRLDEVEVISVPSSLMKTAYDFAAGWVVDDDALQINMLLIHPSAVITPVSYQFAYLDSPTAVTEGKYIYFEESFEDVFILNKRKGALAFNVTPKETRLKSLSIGSLTLTPAFDPDVTAYTASTSTATNTVTAVAKNSLATVAIKNGDTPVTSGSAATWSAGENTLTVTVTDGAATKTYTVTVTKS